MNIDELRDKINNGDLTIDEKSASIIEKGEIKNSNGKKTEYFISHGWNITISAICDNSWRASRLKLFEYIKKQNYEEKYLSEVLKSIQMEDQHWDWFLKSIRYSSDEYNWFYLIAENKPQGVCLIYHPKESVLQKTNIFYIEYIASAPWNRPCLICKREYLGVGTILIKCVLQFAVKKLNLTPGFSLLSLPQAKEYYKKLKMVNIISHNKEDMEYFELPKEEAEMLMEKVR